jgi:hypothetical protein
VAEADYLTLQQALDWKVAHKTAKKASRAPSLPGARRLEVLRDRDHAFIVDDGASMAGHWPAVQATFAALSYILKPMSPDGIELFFAVAYDAWRRKNTSELCELLEKKRVVASPTDIAYRLKLQLQAYGVRVAAETAPPSLKKKDKAKKAALRPLSLYVLTDGAWKGGADPVPHIKAVAAQLTKAGLRDRAQVTITFVSFCDDAAALQRIQGVAETDFGL